jgi:hypothetical protein
MAVDDPEAYRSEVLGEFRAGLSSLFDPDVLDACVVPGRRELEPNPRVYYEAFVDPSGGRGDSFTMAIGHRTEGRVIVDLVRAWPPPFSPAEVVREIATTLERYRIDRVRGDRYAGEWPAERFREHRVRYFVAESPKSELYLHSLLPAVTAGSVELLDSPDLLRELRGLERRQGPSGRDRVEHRPGAHDDIANAVAGLVSILPRASERLREEPRKQFKTTWEIFNHRMRTAIERSRKPMPRRRLPPYMRTGRPIGDRH